MRKSSIFALFCVVGGLALMAVGHAWGAQRSIEVEIFGARVQMSAPMVFRNVTVWQDAPIDDIPAPDVPSHTFSQDAPIDDVPAPDVPSHTFSD